MKTNITIFLLIISCLLSAQTAVEEKQKQQEMLVKLTEQIMKFEEDSRIIKARADSLTNALKGKKVIDSTEYISIQASSGLLIDSYQQTNFITVNLLPFASCKDSSFLTRDFMLTVGYSIGNSTGTLNRTALYGLTGRFNKYSGLTIACAHNQKENKAYFYAGLSLDLKIFSAYNMVKSILIEE